MAIDDVVSDWETAASAGVAVSLQPASGDEWLVTHIFVENEWTLRSHTDTTDWEFGPVGDNTAVTSNWNLSGGGIIPIRIFVTNSEYVKVVRTGPGGERTMGYSAIKTKD